MNQAARQRARSRARRRVATLHRTEFHVLLDEVPRPVKSGDIARCMREICRSHPEDFARAQKVERAKEMMPPARQTTCGTLAGRRKHYRHHEPVCELCQRAWLATLPWRTCKTCDRPYQSERRVYCSTDCQQLYMYLRYFEAPWRTWVNRARYVLKYPKRAKPWEVDHARRVLAEFEATGKVERRRTLPRGVKAPAAVALAKKIGIDLGEAIERVEAKANVV